MAPKTGETILIRDVDYPDEVPSVAVWVSDKTHTEGGYFGDPVLGWAVDHWNQWKPQPKD